MTILDRSMLHSRVVGDISLFQKSMYGMSVMD